MKTQVKVFLCLFFCTQSIYAQQITIKGIVADSTHNLIELATVSLLKPADSSLVQFTSTSEKGAFEFRKVEAKPYLLKINFVGYQVLLKNIDSKVDVNFDTLFLANNTLNEVVLKGEKDAVRITQDTLEFNAGSFKTRTNASVEDLLKKLPGVQVDAKGNIKAQGQEVTKILVNGKEFFGGTPQTATQNLPADAISKVQIIDQKSEQAKLSGTEDGQNAKVINIETKNQHKRMNFGKAMAGYGTDNRYESKANFNTFNKINQFSIIGMSNNINNTGFSGEDYRDFNNRGGGNDNNSMVMMGGDGIYYGNGMNFGWGNNYGFLSTNSIGVNINQSLHKKVELNGSYFLNHTDNIVDKRENSETYLNTNYFATNQNNNQKSINLSHRGNFAISYKPDTMRTFRLQTAIDYNDSNNNTLNQNNSLTNGNILTNESQRENISDAKRLNYRGNLFFSQRFKKTGRTASIVLAANNNNQNTLNRLEARNRFFSPDSLAILNQENTQNTLNQGFNSRTTYSEPLTKKLALSFTHIYQYNANGSEQEVLDIENELRKRNADLSNDFKNSFAYQNGGVSLNFNDKKYRFSLGVASQFSYLKGNTIGSPTLEKRFENIFPNASFGYKFSKQMNLGMNYNTQINAPTISQLQPVPNNSNPLNIISGNPDLRPAYVHRANMSFNYNNPEKFSSIYSFISANYTTNNIVQEQTVDDKLIRTTRPINTRGALRANGNLTYSMNLKKLKSNAEVGVFGNYNQSINVINGITSLVHRQALEGHIGYSWEWEDMLEFSLDASLEHTQTNYEVNPAQNQRFLNQEYEVSLDFEGLEFMTIQSTFVYNINRGVTNDFFQALPMLDVALSIPCLRNDRGELKLRGSNLLNQNTGISQNISGNTIQQEFINSLGRYLMFSFTYSFRDAKKPENAIKK